MDTITKHDDAQAAIRGALPGLRVRFAEFRDDRLRRERTDRVRRYEFELRTHGTQTVHVVGTYELPASATALVAAARRRVGEALRDRLAGEIAP